MILAGGQSRRLGCDKRRLRLWGASGPTLLEHTVALAATLCPEVVVVLNDPEAWPHLPAAIIADRYPDGGALGGIASALELLRTPCALVLACDMPLLAPSLLAAMVALPRAYDLLVPATPQPGASRNPFGVEPLHAIYARSCLGPMQRALSAGERQITCFFPQVRVSYLDAAIVRRHDPDGHSFLSINTPTQLATVERLLGRGDHPSSPPS